MTPATEALPQNLAFLAESESAGTSTSNADAPGGYRPGSLIELAEKATLPPHTQFTEATDCFDEKTKISDDGVIENVVVLRPVSKNKRDYSKVTKEAAAKFEGATIYTDHKDRKSRSVEDICGKIEGLYVDESNTVRAKKLTPCGNKADVLKRSADSASDRCGLSIEAFGNGKVKDGILHVEQIEPADGVALVDKPAAARSLFESVQHEGLLADAINGNEKLELVRKLHSVASDLIWSIIYDRTKSGATQTFAQKKASIESIVSDLLAELKKIDAEGKSETIKTEASSPVESQPLKESIDMDLKTATAEEIRKARPDLFTESDEVKKLRESAEAEKARAEKAEKALNEAEEAGKKSLSVGAIVEKVLAEGNVPQNKRTKLLIEQLTAAETEDRMKLVLEDRMAWGRGESGRTTTIARPVSEVLDGTTANNGGKLLSETITPAALLESVGR